MKKFALFLLLFIFLVSLNWGQTTYIWNGAGGANTSWTNIANWDNANYPGYDYFGDDPRDSAIFTQNATINDINGLAAAGIINLTINSGVTVTLNIGNQTLRVNKLELNGTLNLTSTGAGALVIRDISKTDVVPNVTLPANLTAGAAGQITGSGAVRLNGANTAVTTAQATITAASGNMIYGRSNDGITGTFISLNNLTLTGKTLVVSAPAGNLYAVDIGVVANTNLTTTGFLQYRGVNTYNAYAAANISHGAGIQLYNGHLEFPNAVNITSSLTLVGGGTNPSNNSFTIRNGNISLQGGVTGNNNDFTLVAAGGAIEITTSTNIASVNNLTLNATGAVNVNRDTAVSGCVTLESSGGNIAINNSVTAGNIVLKALSGTVTVAGTATLNTSSNGTGHTSADTAILVQANIFTVNPGTGQIIPGASGILCMWVSNTITLNSKLQPARYHEHNMVNTSGHIVISPTTPTGDLLGYQHIDTAAIMEDSGFSVTGNNNIYIVGAVCNYNLVFSSAQGFIEIRNSCSSPGSLTFNSPVRLGTANVTVSGANITLGAVTGANNNLTVTGTGPVTLNGGNGIGALDVSGSVININADITSAGNQTYNSNVILGGSGAARTLTGGGAGTTVQFNGNVSGSRSLNVSNANADFNQAGGAVNLISVNVSGNSQINANITTSGAQTYNGNVTLGGTGTRTLAGSSLSFGTIAGSGIPLTLNGNASLIGTSSAIGALTINGNTSFQTAALSAESLNVTGSSSIGANITTTGSAGQIYNGQVTLTNGVILYAGTGNQVRLGNASAGIIGSNNPLTIMGNAVFNGTSANTIGNLQVTGNAVFQTAALSAASISINGDTTFSLPPAGNTISTNGAVGQSYNGNVTLTAEVQLSAGTANPVTLGSASGRIEGAGFALTITGSAALNGTSSRLGVLQINQNVIFQSAILSAASVNVSGTSAVNVDIDTTGAQSYTGAVTLGGTAGTTRALQGSIVTLGEIAGNDHPLTITGIGIFNGGSGIGALSVNGNATFQTNGLSADSVSVTGTSAINADITAAAVQTYTGVVTLGGGAVGSARVLTGNAVGASSVVFGSAVNGDRALTITNADVTFNGIVGSTPLRSINVNANAAGGNVRGTTIIGNNATGITTTGEQNYGPVTLAGTNAKTLTSTGGRIEAGAVTGSSAFTVNASQGITLNNNSNVLTGAVTLNNTQGAAQTGNIAFVNTSTALVLRAINNNAAGSISVNQTGALQITELRTSTTAAPTGSITIDAAGNITQSGAIATGNLTIKAGGLITLLSNGNNAGILTITGAGGAVQFANNGAVQIAGVSGIGSNSAVITTTTGAITVSGSVNTSGDVTLTSAGSITVSSGIVTTGNVSLTSASGQSVTISNSINSAVLTLVTGTAATPSGTVTINTSGSITASAGNSVHSQSAAVYISAGTLAGAGGITLSGAAGWVCANIADTLTYTGNVTGGQGIHYHILGGKNILYTTSGTNLTAHPDITSYVRINANSINGTNLEFDSTANVYIVNIAAGAGLGNTRNAIFTAGTNGYIDFRDTNTISGALTLVTSGTGYISFRGNSTLTGVLTLAPAAPVIRLNGTNLNLGTNTYNYNIFLAGTGNTNIVTAAGISLGAVNPVPGAGENNLELAAAAAGSVTFNNAISAGVVHDLKVTASAININQNITTSGNQEYIGGIILGTGGAAPRTLSSLGNQTYNGLLTLNINALFTSSDLAGRGGRLVSFRGIGQDATARTLTVRNANAEFNDNVTVGQIETGTLSENVTTTIKGNADVIATTSDVSNAQRYMGPVRLERNAHFEGAGSGSVIWFNDTVNSSASTYSLTVGNIAGSAGNTRARFTGLVGAAALGTIETIGDARIEAGVTTTGNQTYNGNVTIGPDSGSANVMFTAPAGRMVMFAGTVAGQNDNNRLTVTNANVTFTGGTASPSNIGSIIVNASSGTPGTTTFGNSTTGNFSISTTAGIGALPGGQNYGGPVVFDGISGGTVTLNANSATPITLGAITGLNRNLTINSSATASESVTFNSGNGIGDILVNNNRHAVFAVNTLSAVSVYVTGTSAVNVDITTGGTQTYNGAVTLGGIAGTTRILQGTTVSLGFITGVNHPLTINGDGVFHGGSGIRALHVFGNSLFQTDNLEAASVDVTGTSEIGVNITTTGGTQNYSGYVTLGGATGNAFPRVLTGATVTLGEIIGAGRSLTITGDGVFNGGSGIGALNVSANAVFQNVNMNAASVHVTQSSVINVDITTTGGIQTYMGVVTLGGTANTLRTLTGTMVSFGFINGSNHPLTITGSGSFHGGSGIEALNVSQNASFLTAELSAASVSVTGTSTISVNITTSGSQFYTGAVILSDSVCFKSINQDITINGGISGPRFDVIAESDSGVVTFNGTIIISGAGIEGIGTAAIYIDAFEFAGNATIELNADSEVCAYIDEFTFTGIIHDKIHFHMRHTRECLVYSDNDPIIIDGVTNYLWIQANRPSIGTNPVFHVPGNKKIYILDVNNSTVNPIFFNDNQNDNGFIEFRDTYESGGTITLYPGTGGIRLNNADITLTGKPFAVANANNDVLLTSGNSIIKAASVTVNNITGLAVNNLEITTEADGNISITGSIQSIGNLTINNSAIVTVTGNVGTSALRIGDITVASSGGTAGFDGSVYAESYSQTGTGSADFAAPQNYSDNFSFTGNALTVHGNMNVGGTTAVNNTGLFTLTAPIVSSGSVLKSSAGDSRIGADISATGSAPPMPGTSIEFNNTITLTHNVSLFANNGNINLHTVETTSAHTFAMNSGTGDITVTGDIGTLNDRLGAVNINGADIALQNIFSGNNISIHGADMTMLNIFSGNNIAIDGAVISLMSINAAGSTSIANSGVFTASSDIISDNGFFQQTDSAGISVLGGNVTARGANIVFINQITMNNDIEFKTIAAADGSILLESVENNVSPVKNITFTAGRGNITVSGSIGNDNPLGKITVVSAQDTAFTGKITAESFTQENGGGTTIFNGEQNYSAGFDFTGFNLTVNNALYTDTDISNDDGEINVTSSGLFTVGAVPGEIAPNGENGKITVMGNTVNNGIIAAGPVNNSSQIAIDFYGNYTASANGELTGNPASDHGIQFRKNVILGTHTHNNNPVIFNYSAVPHELSVVSPAIPVPIFADVIIAHDNRVEVFALSGFRQDNGKTLTLGNNAVLEVSKGSWHIGKEGNLTNDFAGINGELILGTGAEIYVNDLNLTGTDSPSASFSISNTLNSIIYIKGDVDISSNVILDKGGIANYPLLRFEMVGNERDELQNLITDQVLGSLHVKINSQTVLSTRNADETIYFRGEVKIFAVKPPLGLDAGSFNLVMYSGLKGYRNLSSYMHGNSGDDEIYFARWEVTDAELSAPPPFAVTPKMDNFVFRQNYGHKISFKRDPDDTGANPVFFEIVGNTMWQEFECLEGGSFIQFSRHPHQHTVLDNFRITGEENNYVTITRLTDENYAYPYEYDPSYMGIPPNTVNVNGPYALPAFFPPVNLKNAGPVESGKYWNINLVSSRNPDFRPLAGFSHVRIFFSHAYNQRIPIEAKRMNLDVIPYWRDNNPALDPPVFREGYFNFDWVELRKILYSFTEDVNGNGRLDRIRVQTNISLNGDFSKFDAVVEGYKIDSSKYSRGYQMVNDFTGTGVFDDDSFYIYLIEDPDIDSGVTPMWYVKNNGSLQDALTGTPVGDPEVDVNIKPFDTIPPRIAYSLTLPGHPQTYVRMSEPVNAGNVSGISLNSSDVNVIETTPPYTFYWYYYQFEQNDMPEIKEMPVPEANLGYLLNWSSPFSVDTLSKLKNIHTDQTSALEEGYFQIENVFDQGQRAMDWSDFMLDEAFFIFYQPPKYPLNWGYTKYAKVMGNSHLVTQDLKEDEPEAAIITDAGPATIPLSDVFIPPNKMLTVEMMQTIADGKGDQITPSSFASYNNADDIIIRRVTDSLVSIPPGSVNSAGFFAWPVWAKHREALNKDPFNDNDIFWGQEQTDTGIIWEFDGTKYLEAFYLEERGDIIMQTRLGSSLEKVKMELFWSVNIPEKLRFPKEAPLRGRSSGGLWLPGASALQTNEKLLYYFTPVYGENEINSQNPIDDSFPLYTYNFGKIVSGSRVDFIYRMNTSDMYIARLDAPIDTIPDNWYKLVRPFSFDIQDIRRQRGGVTILNNVINPGNQESTFIRYHLVRPGRVTIQVYTLDGTLVKSIRRNENRAAGEYTDPWDGTNNGGRPVARGMYFVRVVAPDIDEIRKIMVVR